MTKKEMLKEIKFPVLTPHANTYQGIHDGEPVPNSWIMCFVDLDKVGAFPALYKWQKENNPKNIIQWTYVNIEATTGLRRNIPYPHLKDDKVILICDEKDVNLIIKP